MNLMHISIGNMNLHQVHQNLIDSLSKISSPIAVLFINLGLLTSKEPPELACGSPCLSHAYFFLLLGKVKHFPMCTLRISNWLNGCRKLL